ncbi:DNA polymerase III subunit delta [Mucisphaera calidilacus]|uniref:DNA polymerase III subunit delta n=1 Tax=Mucisphaera calidilacus TaxID=2527982 RepID=A0A518BXN8_9BACT|nr:DNA polymerase III subunit delta [Mucisphaera calidilacus]QDU71747.1 DNA polymerase III subunit delta [Mucisphaera calidilacus]
MARKSSAQVDLDTSMRIVVLCGKERLLQQLRLRGLMASIREEHGETEPMVVDGGSVELDRVLDELRTFGLMVAHKVVVVEDAEGFVKEHRAALERYAEAPAEHATLVLRSPVWRAGKLDKLIAKVGAVVKCEPMREGEAATWLSERAKSEHGVKLGADTARLLVDRLGVDLARLDQEVGKLAAMVEGEAISRDDVERMSGRTHEEAAWGVQDAMLTSMSRRDAGPVLREVRDLVDLGGQSEVGVTYFVGDGIRKLSLIQRYASRRMGGGEIAKRVKLWGAGADRFMKAASVLDPAAVNRLFDAAVERDVRTKRGFGDGRRNLETLCVGLADVLD